MVLRYKKYYRIPLLEKKKMKTELKIITVGKRENEI
jgi:hypothetical protein